MKKFVVMKMPFVLGLLLFILCQNSFANRTPAQVELNDVVYTFDKTKMQAANDSFHFLRSFVDYYYLLAKANQNKFSIMSDDIWKTSAWCVGDAHPENFGVLIQENGQQVFTHNDFDDAGPCPAVLDLFRFMVSSKLYAPDIEIKKILSAYRKGVEGKDFDIPDAIKALLKKSAKKGILPNANKVSGNRFVREAGMEEVDVLTAKQMTSFVKGNILDMIATSKVGGGSGGLKRYEVLVQNKSGLVHLEFKEEIRPSVYPVLTSSLPDTATQIMQAIKYNQGKNYSSYYNVIVIDGKSMMIRPRFWGNVGVTLLDNTVPDNIEIIFYEAYRLGMIHAKSLEKPKNWSDKLKSIDEYTWIQDVDLMVKKFDAKFRELKK